MRFVLFVSLIISGISSSPAVAQSLDAGLETFKSEVVNAYKNADQGQVRSLLHPKSLACIQAEPRYERYLLKAETGQPLPNDAKVNVAPVAASTVLPYRGFTFPLRPSHLIHMEFGKKVSADGRSSYTQTSDKYIGRANDRWYLIMPCPTPEGLGRLRDMGLLD